MTTRSRLPKMPKPQMETYTIKVKATFASENGKDSTADGTQFEKELRELIRKFKAKSEFKHNITTETVSYPKSGT